ncbi:MAG: CRISPR-associated endonuclease Cas1 [Candidatus Omnitrophota bacterium]
MNEAESSFPVILSLPDFIPARMLNEFAYCPRLCYLEWAQQEWDDNEWTMDGNFQHRRVDRPSGDLPDADEMEEQAPEAVHARSVMLSAEGCGFIAKMDLIEAEAGAVLPVEYKRGSVPDNPERSWEPERVQLCAQAMILRENGYVCPTGVLYYAQSRQRVEIAITDALAARTLEIARELRCVMQSGETPRPLQDSPKCPGCSLAGICLPDEILHEAAHPNAEAEEDAIRRLYPARDDAAPLYVQDQGAYVGKSNEELVVKLKGTKVADIRFIDLSHVCLYGNVQISTQAIQELLKRSIPLLYFSFGGWFNGICGGMPHKNVELRRRQYRAEYGKESLEIARVLVQNKIQNSRILLRRNSAEGNEDAIEDLRRAEQQAGEAANMESLLGFEGNAARIYFQHFSSMLKPKESDGGLSGFDFTTRNRRPPRDPVNAMLSFAYSLLTKEFAIVLLRVGFDPFMGFYHQPRYGRPALALDMMEPFRPLIADSVVISVINNGVIQSKDFVRSAGAFALKPDARKAFIMTYERRMDSLITHPIFNYRISYRRVLEVQARLLARYLLGELPTPPEFCTR